MKIDYQYLPKTLDLVKDALADDKAKLKIRSEIDVGLLNANEAACKALIKLYDERELWESARSNKKEDVASAIDNIVKPNHFKDMCLPVTADALRRWGFKPPEDADKLISQAREACSKLSSVVYNIETAINQARIAIDELRRATCDLFSAFKSSTQNPVEADKLRPAVVSTLEDVTKVISGGMIMAFLTPELKSQIYSNFTSVGIAAISVIAIQMILKYKK